MIVGKTIDVNVKPNFVELQGKSLFFPMLFILMFLSL
jgi:hypothetical protein